MKNGWVKDGKGQSHPSGAYVEQDERNHCWWAYPYKESWVSAECKNETEAKKIAIRDKQMVDKIRDIKYN